MITVRPQPGKYAYWDAGQVLRGERPLGRTLNSCSLAAFRGSILAMGSGFWSLGCHHTPALNLNSGSRVEAWEGAREGLRLKAATLAPSTGQAGKPLKLTHLSGKRVRQADEHKSGCEGAETKAKKRTFGKIVKHPARESASVA